MIWWIWSVSWSHGCWVPVLCVACSWVMQKLPKHRLCLLPRAPEPPQILRPWSRDPSARVAASEVNLLEPSQNVNYAPFPLQVLMRNKGIKRGRDVLSFAQSWGNHISFTAVKLNSWICETAVDVQADSLACKRNREREQVRELFPPAFKALIPADPWAWLHCQS